MPSRWKFGLMAGALLVVTACGGPAAGGGVASVSGAKGAVSTSAAPAGSAEDQVRAYVTCMRKNGVDLPDPGPSGGIPGISFDPEKEDVVNAAIEACRALAPSGVEAEKPDAAALDGLREQAQCLRQNGLDVPDPTPSAPSLQIPRDADPATQSKAIGACGGGSLTVAR